MLKQEVQALVEKFMADLEVFVEAQVEKHADDMVEAILKEVAAKIPGQIDDVIIAAIKEPLKAIVVAELKKLADKISKA